MKFFNPIERKVLGGYASQLCAREDEKMVMGHNYLSDSHGNTIADYDINREVFGELIPPKYRSYSLERHYERPLYERATLWIRFQDYEHIITDTEDLIVFLRSFR